MWEEAIDEATKKPELILEEELNKKYLIYALSMFDRTTLEGIETSVWSAAFALRQGTNNRKPYKVLIHTAH